MKCTKANYPYSFWLTGFFNCTGFLTSVKQEITRLGTPGGAKWSLDKVMIITKVMKTNIIEDKETG